MCPCCTKVSALAHQPDGYLRRYDSDGNVIWTHEFGSGVFDLVTGLGTAGSSIYLAGDTSCSIQDDSPFSGGNRDVFVMQMAIDPATAPGKIQLLVGQLETLRDKGRFVPGEFNSVVGYLEQAQAALQKQD